MADPIVSIGGREFPVPELAIAQLREVFPALGRLAHVANSSTSLMQIGREDFGLLLDTVFIGIAAGSPGYRRAEFDKLHAKPAELLGALTVVAQQSGMLAKPGEAATNGTGEAPATIPLNGTESSPISSAQPDGLGTISSSE